MSKHLTPFAVCERQFGKPEQIAAILGLQEKAPYYWRHPSKGRDAGDLPSARHMRRLLRHADQNLIVLKPEWLISGATEDEIEQAEAEVAFGLACEAAASPMEAAE